MNNSFALLCSLGILLVAVRGQGQVNSSFQYENEPWSTNVSSNPYGKTVKLNCTIRLPQGLSRKQVNILWYRSPNHSRQAQCQINLASPCDIKPFSPPHPDLTVNKSYFSKPLIIRNVSASAIGCYWCRGFICGDKICSSIYPIGDPSATFCLHSEAYYQQLFSYTLSTVIHPTPSLYIQSSHFNKPSVTTDYTVALFSTSAFEFASFSSSSTQSSSSSSSSSSFFTTRIRNISFKTAISFSSSSSSSLFSSSSSSSSSPSSSSLSSSFHYFPNTLSCSTSITLIVSPTTTADSNNMSESILAHWLFISLGVCALLLMITCILTTLTIYQCIRRKNVKQNCDNYSTESITHECYNGKHTTITTVDDGVHLASSDDDSYKHSTKHLPRIGYRFVQQVGDKESSSAATLSKLGNIFNTVSSSQEEDDSVSPDKCQLSADDYYDCAQYDDHNYSLVTSPQLSSPPYHLGLTDHGYSIPKKPPVLAVTAENVYDTPAPSHSACDHAYAYATMHDVSEQPRQETHTKTTENFCEEVIQLVHQGNYEVDPQLAFIVQTERRRKMLENGHYQLPQSPAIASFSGGGKEEKHHNEKRDEVESEPPKRFNPYQSIDRSALAEDNSYYTMVK